mgnify:CR=1 FL=1
MKYSFLCLSTLTILACQTTPETQEKPFDKVTHLMDQYANEALRKGNLNSISLGIYRNGNTYHNYYGELQKNTANPPNDQTLFEIASISKVFLGSLMAQAVVENKISLEDDIRMYLNGDYQNLEFDGTAITVRDLLTHTIGFDTPARLKSTYHKIFQGAYKDTNIEYSMEDLFEELKTVELIREPGTYYDYNNVGSELAAYILEQINHQPYQAQLQGFFDSLDMQNTYLQDFERHRDHLAVGYDENNKLASITKNPLLGGSAGIISTVPDLMKLMKFQLESGHPLVKEATKVLFEDDDDNVIGYLWQDMGVAEEEGFYYSKSGDANGIKSIMLICPDSDYGQLVIINNQSEAAGDDWATLFNQMETDLIKYPKINLKSWLKPAFIEDKKRAKAQFNELKKKEDSYFNTNLIWVLNRIGYDLLYNEKNTQEAIQMFEFALIEDPENANLYDSLGEAFLVSKDYEKALINYKKSLALNPDNEGAKASIDKINQLNDQ